MDKECVNALFTMSFDDWCEEEIKSDNPSRECMEKYRYYDTVIGHYCPYYLRDNISSSSLMRKFRDHKYKMRKAEE